MGESAGAGDAVFEERVLTIGAGIGGSADVMATSGSPLVPDPCCAFARAAEWSASFVSAQDHELDVQILFDQIRNKPHTCIDNCLIRLLMAVTSI